MSKIFIVAFAFVCCLPAIARGDTQIFPPWAFGASNPPASGSPECVITYAAGQPHTYCRNAPQTLDFTVPNKPAGQTVLKRAMPTCAAGQFVSFDGSSFVCVTLSSGGAP